MSQPADIIDLLRLASERRASDLILTVGLPPMLRLDGEWQPTVGDPLTPNDTRRLLYTMMDEKKQRDFEERRELDFSFSLTGQGRFRVNAFFQRGAVGGVLRTIPGEILSFDKMGLPQVVAETVKAPRGLVLVTGPTGSGKSTTLYSALNSINSIDKNIITIEDPVEYQLSGVNQLQVNMRAGLTFARGLRSMLRADPDVIMVGEIRDAETARIAVESALTGHLVLSTLHTNDAPSAVTRLTEMGIEPFLTASALDTIVAQRLVRVLCSHCKHLTMITPEALGAAGFHATIDVEAYEPVGCGRCGASGYKGRIGLYEVMTITEEIRKLTIARASADEIAEVAVRSGMRHLREDGLEKIRLGRTSLAEVARVTGTGAAVF